MRAWYTLVLYRLLGKVYSVFQLGHCVEARKFLLQALEKANSDKAHAYQGMADARVSISGSVEALGNSDQAAAARSTFRKKYPDSFWVDFGALAQGRQHMFP